MNIIRIETLGCRLNQIESESAAHYFIKKKFCVQMNPVTSNTEPDDDTKLVIINTCTVTQKAEQKARRIIRLVLKKYENACVLITGCYAQLASNELINIDKRIVVLGGQIKSRLILLPDFLFNYLNENDWNVFDFIDILKQKVLNIPQEKIGYPEKSFNLSGTSLIAHSRASLKIQDGCNNNCSYCAIHLARGHSVSLDVNTAIKRVQELEDLGNDEVVLTTINIAQYKGKYISTDNKESYFDFSSLLEILLKSTNKINFRISSLYPEIVTPKFLEVIKDDRVCPHFHISVQSGSNKILSLMNRRYIAEDVIKACNEIRKVKKNPFIACDIITGFPGETEEDFQQTLNLCKKCDFTWIHSFPFSERRGTTACLLKNKVPQFISGNRTKQLTKFACQQKIKYIKSFENKELIGILETVKEKNIDSEGFITYHVLTQNFIHCKIISKDHKQTCKLVKIKIISILENEINNLEELEALAIFVD